MKIIISLLIYVVSFSTSASICTTNIPLETEIDQTKNIFIAQITSVKMSNGNVKNEDGKFITTFNVLKNIKGSASKNIEYLSDSGSSSRFSPGSFYLIFTNHGKIKHCINSIYNLSFGYPELFDHENYFIESIEEYIKLGKNINEENIYDSYKNHYDNNKCNL